MIQVIYSPNDFDLLLKMRDDLVKAGMKDDREWNDMQIFMERKYGIGENISFCDRNVWSAWLNIDKKKMGLFNHDCNLPSTALTPEKYSSILAQVLQERGLTATMNDTPLT